MDELNKIKVNDIVIVKGWNKGIYDPITTIEKGHVVGIVIKETNGKYMIDVLNSVTSYINVPAEQLEVITKQEAILIMFEGYPLVE